MLGRLHRYPYVAQHDQTDCAAACLAMVTAYHGRPVGVARLRDLANVDADGASLWSVARAAEAVGFHARGLRVELESLTDLRLPAIAHWNGAHYVVVYEVTRRHVLVGDPALGRRRLTRSEFAAGWTRCLLELVPSERTTERGVRDASPWRRFLPVVRPFRTILVEVVLASLALSAIGLAVPLCTQVVVDRVLVHESRGLLDMLTVGMLGLAVFRTVFQSLRRLVLVHVSTAIEARLVGDFLAHLLALPLRYFDVRRVGDSVMRLTEAEKVRSALASTLPALCLDSVLAVSCFALLLGYGLDLTLFVAVFVALLAGAMRVFTPIMRQNLREQFARYTEAATGAIEAVGGIRAIKSMAAEPVFRARLESLFATSLRVTLRGDRISVAYSAVASLLQLTSAALFLWLGAHRVIDGQMSPGQMLAFVTLAASVLAPVVDLVAHWDALQDARSAAERLGDVFSSEVEQPQSADRLALERVEGRICFEDVSFAYRQGDTPLLAGIDLEIEPGQRVAIVGASGSGKSTLAKLALGLYAPTRGRVLVDGHDLRTLSLPALRRRFGVVPQEPFLCSGSIRDNIALGRPDASLADVVAAARAAGVHEELSRLGYDAQVGEAGSSLSGGQRQRIAIARALLHDPDLLIFDEATSALDGASENEVRACIEAASRGRTTLLIAHRSAAIRSADRILVLEKGHIVEDGTHDELVRRAGAYARMFDHGATRGAA